MVLTRAQRAQTKATPPESPLKTSVLKAPARRARAKKPDVEAEQRPQKVTHAVAKTSTTTRATGGTKTSEVNAAVGRAAAARTAATKAPAAKAAPARAAVNSVRKTSSVTISNKGTRLKESASKPDTNKSSTNTSRSARARANKVSEIVRSAPDDQSSDTVAHTTNGGSADIEASVPTEENLIQVKPLHIFQGEVEPIPRELGVVIVPEANVPIHEDEEQAITPARPSPTKLPIPVTASVQCCSPSKTSVLSSAEGLGSVRKPEVSGALFASPAKSNALAHYPPQSVMSDYGDVRLDTSIRDFGSALATSPKRQFGEVAAITSLKRLKMVKSMPSIRSPYLSQDHVSDSPSSPTKSSLRSPEKRPGVSPKKVSWHQTPPPPPPQRAIEFHQSSPPSAPGILSGCIFYLDVNSLDGVNQNALFTGLVQELGGSCVESWSHNNMGITHVLFMNGEMRTLEKVLASHGDVWCVSLGWLLDCQREKLRIPESQPRYQVDLSHVPGHTPKHKGTNLNTPRTARTPGPVPHTPAVPPPRWALPNTPAIPRETLGALSSSLLIRTPAFLATKTPGPPPSVGVGAIPDYDKENMSPISEATPLIQKTCPPKQLNQSILGMSTGISATPLRNKFLASKRRRSFNGAQRPAVGASSFRNGLCSPRRFALGTPVKKR